MDIKCFVYFCGAGLVNSTSQPEVPGSIRPLGRLAADSAVCDFAVV
jgi:hypothetical protein